MYVCCYAFDQCCSHDYTQGPQAVLRDRRVPHQLHHRQRGEPSMLAAGSSSSSRAGRWRCSVPCNAMQCNAVRPRAQVEALVTLFTTVMGKRPRFRAHGGTTPENLALQNIQARVGRGGAGSPRLPAWHSPVGISPGWWHKTAAMQPLAPGRGLACVLASRLAARARLAGSAQAACAHTRQAGPVRVPLARRRGCAWWWPSCWRSSRRGSAAGPASCSCWALPTWTSA